MSRPLTNINIAMRQENERYIVRCDACPLWKPQPMKLEANAQSLVDGHRYIHRTGAA
jgi:hypothetical protein